MSLRLVKLPEAIHLIRVVARNDSCRSLKTENAGKRPFIFGNRGIHLSVGNAAGAVVEGAELMRLRAAAN
jgi:hypothetical protein